MAVEGGVATGRMRIGIRMGCKEEFECDARRLWEDMVSLGAMELAGERAERGGPHNHHHSHWLHSPITTRRRFGGRTAQESPIKDVGAQQRR